MSWLDALFGKANEDVGPEGSGREYYDSEEDYEATSRDLAHGRQDRRDSSDRYYRESRQHMRDMGQDPDLQ